MNTNNPPLVKWWRTVMGWDGIRYRLSVDGRETPYFIDAASNIAHRTMGEKYGLFGAGMRPSGCAMTLGAFPRLDMAKARAETMALS